MGTTPRGFPYPESSDKVSDGYQAIEDLAEAVDDEFDGLSGIYLSLAGGTMTGDLVLAGAPDADLKAATKKYVDDEISAAPIPLIASGSYVGNGSGPRTIPIGFAPDAVDIFLDDENARIWALRSTASGRYFTGTGTSVRTDLKIDPSNGFTVGGDLAGANANGTTYRWIAWKAA